jgi:UDP-glucuronate decarboxylase
VVVVDNFFTGSHHNLAQHLGKANFELIRHDVVQPILIEARVGCLRRLCGCALRV